MHDVLPEDQPLWRLVRETAARVASLFGYEELTLPIVENASVFQRTSGGDSDLVSKEMYLFEDRGGERIALRPEGTAGVCRAYLEHGMASRPQPVRVWYLGPFFRYDRPQAGRYRQLWQFGVENIGDGAPSADVEVIELQHMLYRELGLGELVLRINSIGTAETRRAYAEALRAHLEPKRDSLSPDSQRRLETNVLRILDSKEEADRAAVAEAPSILDHLTAEDAEHFSRVRGYLDALGITYVVDPMIVRGLDYYSRTVWEFEPVEAGGQSTVGAGGRYDGLMELLGGQPTPGVGFATGIERIVMNLRQADTDLGERERPDVAMIALGEQGPAAAMRVAAELRAAGLRVRSASPDRGMRAQMRAAGSSEAAYAVIVGDEEAREGVAQLKPLRGEGEQRTVPLDGLAEAVRRGL